MVLEVGRRFVNGAWVTDVADESAGGGSQPITVVRVPLAFNTPGFNAVDGSSVGVVVYTPSAGDVVLWQNSYISIPTAFNGDAIPSVSLTYSDLDGAYSGAYSLTSANGAQSDGHTLYPPINADGDQVWQSSVQSIFPDATPLRAVLDDGAGNPDNSTAGEIEIVLFIVPAA